MRNDLILPSVVFFDLDDTLYDYESAHNAGLHAVRSKAHQQLGVSASEFDRLFDVARKEVKQRLGATASSHSRLLYFQRLIELVGLKTQALLSLDFEQTYWRTFLGAATLFPGVIDLLEELHLLGIPRVLVTDLTAQIQFRKIVHFQLEGHFDAVVTSEEAGVEKPDPRIFHLALAKIGAEKGNFWMIGDDLKKDMAGARSALDAVTFWRTRPTVFPRSAPDSVDMSFDHFDQIRRVVRSAAAGSRYAIAVGE